ncbi:hypothetical protein, partial [Bacteroides thetaiotaomicron]|uniref:hypothetical protein n=1 Tax=Bacteroides thetaiotaomicron TaxID=818 RepID=UPI001C37DD04
ISLNAYQLNLNEYSWLILRNSKPSAFIEGCSNKAPFSPVSLDSISLYLPKDFWALETFESSSGLIRYALRDIQKIKTVD